MAQKTSHIQQIASQLKIRPDQVLAVANLLKDGATVPFIARYRKEVTGELDEVAISSIRDNLAKAQELDDRREFILNTISEQGKLTEDLKLSIENATTLSELEDLYLPYRPKRRTRAQTAREAGLEPLAELLFAQNSSTNPTEEAAKFINEEKSVFDAEAALAGARDILAEKISETSEVRQQMRSFFDEEAVASSLVVEGKEEEGVKYSEYFDAQEPLSKIPSHRLLALLRGESDGVLSLSIRPPKEEARELLKQYFVKGSSAASTEVALACDSAYTRMLAPSMEVEARLRAFTKASDAAIEVFATNLRELLMAAPLGRKAVLALDPGIRTGCKVVCLDPQGKLLHDCVVQLARSDAERRQAADTLTELVERYKIAAIAIGNGTYGRETMAFVRALELPSEVVVVSVNESGASIYSASEVAREEFPDKDITVRGAVSIGRRLMDPLAELVKLDPKSIGVGQYQHDVDQTHLRRALDDTVLSCVNSVGVEVNTASVQLLTHVSGIGQTLAENIVSYRNEHGPFRSRAELKSVPRMGPKAFEQSAGFLRISGGTNPLDASAVHPESYPIVAQMARDLSLSLSELLAQADKASRLDLKKYVTETVGLPTLQDIVGELAKPGRDPREKFEVFSFAEGVHTPEDLRPGMKLPGIVTNVTAFGAFVDIGVHQDGLVHISELQDKYTDDPSRVVHAGQKVEVRVLSVDTQRKRIALSMRSGAAAAAGGGAGAGGRRDGARPQNTPRGGSRPASRPRETAPVNNNPFGSALDGLFR